MDAIERIRDFALRAPPAMREPVDRYNASTAQAFDSPRRREPRGLAPPVPGEDEMCRLVRPYRCVVRVDADARKENRPSIKLFRFEDRARAVGTFASFADVMDWLTQRA